VNALRHLAGLVRRTLLGLAPGLARPDDAFALGWLVAGEADAYRAMDPRDRDHACRVARRLLAQYPGAQPHTVRAALLHDVGKAERPYRVWERVLAHVWTPGPATARRFPAALRGAWRVHAEHAALGAGRLRALGVDARVVELVARHHEAPAGDEELRRLIAADEAT
jgi:putative nucleotidyltransferase with HDIG domain